MRWSEITEYILLVGSVFGIAGSVITRQIIYSVTPLSLTVGLNIANRKYFEKDLEHRIQEKLSLVSNSVSGIKNDFQKLDDSVKNLASLETIEDLENSTSILDRRLTRVESLSVPVDLTVVETNIRSLDNRLNTLEAMIGNLPSLGRVSNLEDFTSGINQRISELENLYSLMDLTATDSAVSELEHRLGAVENLINGLPSFDRINSVDETARYILEEIQNSILKWVEGIIGHLNSLRPYSYSLVVDRSGSQVEFNKAISNAQKRLILVNPWLRDGMFNDNVKYHLEGFLKQKEKLILVGGIGAIQVLQSLVKLHVKSF